MAFDEAAALESSGVPAKQKLAKLLLAELEGSIISTALPAAPAPERALDVDGNHRPFALEPPRTAEPGPSADQPASEPQQQDTPRATPAWATARVEEEPNEGSGRYQAGSGGSLPGTTPTRSDIIMGRKRLSLATERGPVSMLPRILCAVVVDVSASTFASGAARCHHCRAAAVPRRGAQRLVTDQETELGDRGLFRHDPGAFSLRARHRVGGA